MRGSFAERIVKTALGLIIVLAILCPHPLWAGSFTDKIDDMAEDLATGIASSGKSRVAVAKFTTVDKKTSSFGQLVAEKLANGLIRHAKNRYSVTERSLVDRIMGERTGLTAEDAQQMLQADILVTGTYTILENKVDLSARAIDLALARAVAAEGITIPTKEVQSLLDVQPEQTAQSQMPEKKDLELSLEILAFKYIGGTDREVVVRNGDVLQSGDEFKVNFEVSRDCYFYVLYYDSMAKAGVLFPNPKIALDNSVRGGVAYSLPGEDLTFQLDRIPGTETLYFVASLEPMNDIDRLLTDMEKAGEKGKKRINSRLQQAIGTRGINITTSNAPSAFGNRDRVMEVVKGHTSLFKVFEFQHR